MFFLRKKPKSPRPENPIRTLSFSTHNPQAPCTHEFHITDMQTKEWSDDDTINYFHLTCIKCNQEKQISEGELAELKKYFIVINGKGETL